MASRQSSFSDRLLSHADRALRSLFGRAKPERSGPAPAAEELPLDATARRQSIALMRVNHAGEIAAQALYHGQSLTARDPEVRHLLDRAAREEHDHLAWCRQRVQELGGRTSLLDPVWYAGAFAIGALTGLAGDRWNLGFVAETERQVIAHLDRHLARLPVVDASSRAVLEQMREDEARHGEEASRAGGQSLPQPIRAAMTAAGRIMTGSSYWL